MNDGSETGIFKIHYSIKGGTALDYDFASVLSHIKVYHFTIGKVSHFYVYQHEGKILI